LDVGGVETNLVTLAQAFAARGHAVTVAAAPGPLQASLGPHVAYHAVSANGDTPWRLWRAASDVARLMQDQALEVVHAFSPRATLVGWLARSLAGRRNGLRRGPLIVSVPGGLQESPAEPPWVTYSRLWPLWGADRVLAISQEIRHTLARLPGLPPRITSLCHIGLDLARFRPGRQTAAAQQLRAAWGWPSPTPLIGTIGACMSRKSHDLFLRAAGLVHGQRPEARFLIVGEGPLRPQLATLSHRLGLEGVVRFVGQREDIPAVLEALDCYIKPGVVEGFVGITVLEAMAMEKPVIAFETEDVKAAIRDGDTGVLVRRGDVLALSQAILRLLAEPLFARRLGRAGRQFVEEQFEASAVAARLERYYLEALGA